MISRETSLIRPSWMVLCAHGAFWSVVPSAVWRVLMIIGLMPGTASLREFELAGNPALGYAYVIALSVVQMGCAYLAIGFVKPRGERLAGRTILTLLPVILGAAGGIAVMWIFNLSMTSAIARGHRPDAGHVSGWPLVIMAWCYLCILLWGPSRWPPRPATTASVQDPVTNGRRDEPRLARSTDHQDRRVHTVQCGRPQSTLSVGSHGCHR